MRIIAFTASFIIFGELKFNKAATDYFYMKLRYRILLTVVFTKFPIVKSKYFTQKRLMHNV